VIDREQGIRIGSIGGTILHLDYSFLFLCGLFVVFDLQDGSPIQQALLWIPTLFFSVIAHELGHAAAIAALGYGRSDIVLGGFGGVTINNRRARPWQDILISLAGPVAGVVFAYLLVLLFNNVRALANDEFFFRWFALMFRVNIAWAIFNLLPIYPLDGGQILRNTTRIFLTERNSFVTTTWVSLVLAAAIIIFGLLQHQYFLATIAFMLALENYQNWSAFKGGGFRN
jgi:stage IV sporulation protein FB